MIGVTSREFYSPDWAGLGVAGTKYLNHNVGDRVTQIIDFYVKFSSENRSLLISDAKSITLSNSLDLSTFTKDENGKQRFAEGDNFTLVDTLLNNGDYTIDSISDDGRTIYTVEALVNESISGASLFGTTPITDVDFYYNTIGNSAAATFDSLTDTGIVQRFSASGLNASDTGTYKNFFAAAESFAWVTNALDDANTGETSEVTIIGQGIVDYKQQFRISHTFILTPVVIRQYFDALNKNTVPADYPINCIVQMDAFYGDAIQPPHSITVTDPEGFTAWFNRTNKGKRSDYYIDSVAYSNYSDALSYLDSIDLSTITQVDVELKSYSGKFTAATKVLLNIMWATLNESDYKATVTTLPQNFNYDRKQVTCGDAAANGEMNGTNYQNFQHIEATYVDANTITLKFRINLAGQLNNILRARDAFNRMFLMWFTTQDVTIATSEQTDRTSIPVFASAVWNQDQAGMFQFTSTGILAYQYPDEVTRPAGSIEGAPGDQFFIRVPFQISKLAILGGGTATVQSISAQVIATEGDPLTDFILEDKTIDCSQMRKLLGAQQLAMEDTKGYISYEGDPRNRVKLMRVPAADVTNWWAYEFQYGLTLRYDYWKSVYLVPDGVRPAIFDSIESPVHLWSNYNAANGWPLIFRFKILIEGAYGFVTEYDCDIPIVCTPLGANQRPGSIPPTCEVQYFFEDADGNLEEMDCILEDGLTRIRATWTGNFSSLPDSDTLIYGLLFADMEGSGGVFNRQLASSELPSESDSPWSAPAVDPAATSSRKNGNATINFYGNNKVVVDSYFDVSLFRQHAIRVTNGQDSIMIFPRLGYSKPEALILMETGALVLMQTEQGILIDG